MATTSFKYFEPEILSRLENFDLRARGIVEGFIAGMHKSPFHGFSIEFAQHREYVAGDEIKHVDWRVYAKSDKYYIKQYEEETNFVAHILLDTSESMKFGSGEQTKLDYACLMSACLTYLILQQRDSVGMVSFDRKVKEYLRPSGNPSFLQTVLGRLNETEPAEETDVGSVLHELSTRLRRRGMVILISDLLDDLDKIFDGLQHLRFDKHEVMIFHVLDHQERAFELDGLVRFKGLEKVIDVRTEPRRIREMYLNELNKFTKRLREGCDRHGIQLVEVDTTMPIEQVLINFLISRSGK